MRAIVGIVAAAMTVTGCASGSLGLPGPRPPEMLATESFAYGSASNRDLRVTVDQVILAGAPDFIPSDPNWLQLRVTIANAGGRTINLTQVQEQLEGGAVLQSAQSADELIKPPNLVQEGLLNTGIGAAGMAAGMFLFPPAALIGGAILAFRPMFEGDRVGRMAERLNRESLRTGPVAPGSTVSGWIFVPAVRGQTGLIVFYEAGGGAESLVVPRL